MKPRFFIFSFLAVACLAAGGILTFQQIDRYNETREVFPQGSKIAGIPVGGSDAEEAGTQVFLAYSHTPVQVQYGENRFTIDPAAAGLNLSIATMMEQAGAAQASGGYWEGFWNFLWNRAAAPIEVPLACSVDETRLRAFLNEQVVPRYTLSPSAAQPIPGTSTYQPGQPGVVLNIDLAANDLREAMCSLDRRVVELVDSPSASLPPKIDLLEPALQALVQVSGFDGLAEIYFQDLQTGEEILLAMDGRTEVPPEIAFTAASTIKIPVMVSAYKQVEGTLPDGLRVQMAQMIDLSDNASTDAVMQRVLDENIAPVQVTQDMQALGLQNTFLAGFFYPGAPLLDRYQTPANQRSDLTTDPDVYNQTTAADMGRLLAAIQRCADDGSGPLTQAFGGQVTQAECQEMVNLLAKNRKGVLIESGLPDGSQMAHKYGWVVDPVDGLMRNASDAAIVYSPGGDFVLTVYLYHPTQLHWDPAQRLVAMLTELVYNYFNGWQSPAG